MLNDDPRKSVLPILISPILFLLILITGFYGIAIGKFNWFAFLIFTISTGALGSGIMVTYFSYRISQKADKHQQILNSPQTQTEEEETKKDNAHYAYPFDKRMAIVEEYYRDRKAGNARNKDKWAAKYNITGKTLRDYEKEYRKYRKRKETF